METISSKELIAEHSGGNRKARRHIEQIERRIERQRELSQKGKQTALKTKGFAK